MAGPANRCVVSRPRRPGIRGIRETSARLPAREDAEIITGFDLRVDAVAIARYWLWDPGTAEYLTELHPDVLGLEQG